jgi:hypothetical protein
MQGRKILDGLVTLHGRWDGAQSTPKRLNWLILMIDFEKTYDKVKWSFLQLTLRMKDFFVACLIHSFV